ncbi:MAG: vitamin B12 dependent methionine synthase [Clostridiales bacterium]|jgi:hypothetical protein|nr:vitamin B12 dependent methionine synthase [Clostridiales bacterium]
MKQVVLSNIPFKPDRDGLLKKLHMDAGSEDGIRFLDLIRQAEKIGRPKAVYALASIDQKLSDGVVVEGIRLTSRIMRVNFADINRVFPYVITCGRELSEWAAGLEDMLEQYMADLIMEQALEAARRYLYDHLDKEYRLGSFKSMNPGSLEDWPLSQQKQIFQILGKVKEAIGVELNDSCLMLPMKSVSGILFQTESSYENCQLCPREFCPNRRAEYNPQLFEEKYQGAYK